jgi:hypothetical protein
MHDGSRRLLRRDSEETAVRDMWINQEEDSWTGAGIKYDQYFAYRYSSYFSCILRCMHYVIDRSASIELPVSIYISFLSLSTNICVALSLSLLVSSVSTYRK